MLKKIDGLDAKRYRAMRELFIMSINDPVRYESIMLATDEGEDTAEGFDIATDRLIALLENEKVH